MRPRQGKFGLRAEEMDCLDWIVLSGCSREEAFLRFIRPDYLGNRNSPAVRDAVKQFFAMADVRGYMEAYRDTVNDMSREKEVKISGSMEERKARSKTKLVEFAMTLADNIEQADDPEFVLKIADKAGLLDQDEEVVEQPRRYLPESCSSCAYRAFCEENTEDMCQYCRYRAYGAENGLNLSKEEMLDIHTINK